MRTEPREIILFRIKVKHNQISFVFVYYTRRARFVKGDGVGGSRSGAPSAGAFRRNGAAGGAERRFAQTLGYKRLLQLLAAVAKVTFITNCERTGASEQ